MMARAATAAAAMSLCRRMGAASSRATGLSRPGAPDALPSLSARGARCLTVQTPGVPTLEQTAENKCYGGVWSQHTHTSDATAGCTMTFSIYLPSVVAAPGKAHGGASGARVPVLYFLSGLTCTDQNFVTKAGAAQFAEEHGIAIVAPDTSPRGDDVADDDGYDLGKGAGFYLTATQAPWAPHYDMYSYVTEELPALIEEHFPVTDVRSITGHSMGGHGALTIALKNAPRYASVSAFSPICNPTACPWGTKAFTAYLGSDKATWEQYDATLLLRKAKADGTGAPLARPILVDQGADDDFLAEQLMPDALSAACTEVGQAANVRLHGGYDHSYFFIQSFIGEHVAMHAEAMADAGK